MEDGRYAEEHIGINGTFLENLVNIRAVIGEFMSQPDNGLALSL